MPFITVKVNSSLTSEQKLRLKAGLGKLISLVPGKSENSLLVDIEGDCHLFFRGDDSKSIAYITVAVFCNPAARGYDHLSTAIAELFNETLGIDPLQIYIRYEDIPVWSVAGKTFAA